MKINTYAKINLSLLIYKPNKQHYHPICSIFQLISLHDILHIKKNTSKKITITCSNPTIPVDASNILFKAYQLLKPYLKNGYHVHIEKNIPSGAGLGGASTNAAGFLNILNKEALQPKSSLKKWAKQLGSDVSFFLQNSTALVRGIGEKINTIPTKKYYYVLIKAPIHCNTKDIYTALDKTTKLDSPKKTPKQVLKHYLGPNTFIPTVYQLYPQIKRLSDTLSGLTKKEIFMSGSGSTLFFVTHTLKEALLWEKTLKKTQEPSLFIKAVSPQKSPQ